MACELKRWLGQVNRRSSATRSRSAGWPVVDCTAPTPPSELKAIRSARVSAHFRNDLRAASVSPGSISSSWLRDIRNIRTDVVVSKDCRRPPNRSRSKSILSYTSGSGCANSMKRLPKSGASLLTPRRTEGDLKVALRELGAASPFDHAAIHDLYSRIAQICGSWFSEQEAAEVSPVSKALRSTGKSLLEASQLLSGHETGLRTRVEIEATSQLTGILALEPNVGSVGTPKHRPSFPEDAANTGGAAAQGNYRMAKLERFSGCSAGGNRKPILHP